MARKEIATHLIELIEKTGYINDVYIITNDRFFKIFNLWSMTLQTKLNVLVINDMTTSNEERLGAIGDMNYCLKKCDIKDDIMVIAGDNLFNFDLNDFIQFFKEKKTPAITAYDIGDSEKIKMYSYLELNSDNRVIFFEEKPENPLGTMTCPPFYIYPEYCLHYIDQFISSGNNPDAPGYFIQWLYKRLQIYAYLLKESNRFDIGNIESYNEANRIYGELQEGNNNF